MGHYAKVQDGVVVQVIVAEPEFFDSFVDTSPGQWVQTSYNTRGGVHYGDDGIPDGGDPLRKNFAGIGFSYDAARDAFIPPKPSGNYTLNEESCLWDGPSADFEANTDAIATMLVSETISDLRETIDTMDDDAQKSALLAILTILESGNNG